MSTLNAAGHHFPLQIEVNRSRRQKKQLGRIYLSRQEDATGIRESWNIITMADRPAQIPSSGCFRGDRFPTAKKSPVFPVPGVLFHGPHSQSTPKMAWRPVAPGGVWTERLRRRLGCRRDVTFDPTRRKNHGGNKRPPFPLRHQPRFRQGHPREIVLSFPP